MYRSTLFLLLAFSLTACRDKDDTPPTTDDTSSDAADEGSTASDGDAPEDSGAPANTDIDADADADGGTDTGEAEPSMEGDEEGECSDGIDNDEDGTLDCEDTDCTMDPVCDASSSIDTAEPEVDLDEDGFAVEDGDCDDDNASIFPGASELCDGLDNDCDGTIDNDPIDGVVAYLDRDADGHGDPRFMVSECTTPSGYVATGGDCNDTDATTHPDAGERCDGTDNDCDGTIDEDVITTWYLDADGDGFGASADSVDGCDPAPDYVATSTDCDDTTGASRPGALEVCDGKDNDCNELIDDEAIDATTWYADTDGDGYGDSEDTMMACEAPEGFVDSDGDCAIEDSSIHPDADEICDEIDNDCDGETDLDASDAPLWYADIDGDGFGSERFVLSACSPPGGYVDDATDCDDLHASIYPGAEESCDGVDNDCDDVIDEDPIDPSPWYADADEDGYGNGLVSTLACSAPEGFVGNDADCDDTSGDIHPDSPEVCDETDNNCDGTVDTDAIDQPTWFADDDRDGFGDATMPTEACTLPDGHTADATDCDDTNPEVFPDNPEMCDELDNDCDGRIDEDAADQRTWFADEDRDGFGDATMSREACTLPDGYTADDDDCNDASAEIYPGADEICDEVDNDCDEEVDEDAIDPRTWYADADRDGFGDEDTTSLACTSPEGFVGNDGDCNDTNPDVHPDGRELCDGIDNDCDETTDIDAEDPATWYPDLDGDGYGGDAFPVEACEAPSGYTADSTDCDDLSSSTHPSAEEICDEIDNDCDEQIDEDLAVSWYADEDGDGYGNAADGMESCRTPAGHVANDLDCDDENPGSHPGALELCDDADNDCDGEIDEAAIDSDIWYADHDGDGYGTSSDSTASCDIPSGYASVDGDCNDAVASVHPAAEEVCDGLDNDCNGDIDDNALDGRTYYRDSDGDGYGSPVDDTVRCDAPSGYVENGDDCDDLDASISPESVEICDTLDNNCDALIDNEAEDALPWYADMDGDGYGDETDVTMACDPPLDFVDNPDDCFDDNPLRDRCSSCQDFVDAGRDDGDGVYFFDPCGDGEERPFYCDMSHDGGGWTLGGRRTASSGGALGIDESNHPTDTRYTSNLACIDFGEVMVFNETYEFIHTQDVPPSTWPEYLETPVSFGADERYFVQGTYGGTSTMACVDFQYDVTESGCCPCDNDSRGGQKGHLADWAGEFCPGRRLDGTWAWSTGDTCHGRGVDYVWGVAIR